MKMRTTDGEGGEKKSIWTVYLLKTGCYIYLYSFDNCRSLLVRNGVIKDSSSLDDILFFHSCCWQTRREAVIGDGKRR